MTVLASNECNKLSSADFTITTKVPTAWQNSVPRNMNKQWIAVWFSKRETAWRRSQRQGGLKACVPCQQGGFSISLFLCSLLRPIKIENYVEQTLRHLHKSTYWIDGCMSNPSSRADTRGVGFAAARTRHPRVLACCHFQIARPCAARSQLLERSCLGSGTTLRREVLTISATLRTCPSSELIIWAWELLALCRREKLLTIRGKFQRNFAKLLEMNF